MDNSEKYHFSDFTLENYRKYIQTAKEKYVFRSFVNFNKEENFILWRHDVDYSMHAALKLAIIENEKEVQTTYFLHIHNEFYNLFELAITETVKEILNLGHNIGLHFDSGFYINNGNIIDLEKKLIFEKGILETVFNRGVKVFSLHNPGISQIKMNESTYAGMVNANSEYFRNEAAYCSDSFGIWRYQRLEDILRKSEHKRLQVLTHPEWWSEEITSPKERVWNCINGRAEKNKKSYESILKDYGLEVIDW